MRVARHAVSSGSARWRGAHRARTRQRLRARCWTRRARTAPRPRSSPASAARRARAAGHRPRRWRRCTSPTTASSTRMRLTIGYAELAARNGVDVLPLRAGDRHSTREGDRDHRACSPPAAALSARCVVNAAGVEADQISAARRRRAVPLLAAAGPVLAARPRAGRPVRQGRRRRAHARSPAASTASPPPTARCCWGRPPVDHEDRGDRAVDAADARRRCSRPPSALVPAIRREYAIKTFAANRPASDPVYRVERDRNRSRT